MAHLFILDIYIYIHIHTHTHTCTKLEARFTKQENGDSDGQLTRQNLSQLMRHYSANTSVNNGIEDPLNFWDTRKKSRLLSGISLFVILTVFHIGERCVIDCFIVPRRSLVHQRRRVSWIITKPIYQSFIILQCQLDYESLFLENLNLFLVHLFSYSVIQQTKKVIKNFSCLKASQSSNVIFFLIQVMKLFENL